ncbi:hypothetical protein ABZ626_23670 [Streptomyces longispororuber]|uniref:hypothetical protein n=1 Tax=Streptomyces longispororuber TaxID=68230 RepID=UPI0033E7F82C
MKTVGRVCVTLAAAGALSLCGAGMAAAGPLAQGGIGDQIGTAAQGMGQGASSGVGGGVAKDAGKTVGDVAQKAGSAASSLV